MSSDRQLAANRANALKSCGPVTLEGKARSAANARVAHGLASPERAALSAVLRNEDRETFLAFHLALIEELQPVNTIEHIIVREVAVADWRLNRARAMEIALLDNQMDLMAPELADSYESIDHATRAVLAFKKSAGEANALALLLRYTGRLQREAAHTRHELMVRRTAQLRYEIEMARERSKANPEIEHTPEPNQNDDQETSTSHDEQQQLSSGDAALPAAQHPPRKEAASGPGSGRSQLAEPGPRLAPASPPPQMENLPEAPQRDTLRDAGRTPSPLPRAA